MFGRKQQRLIGSAMGLLARLRKDARGNTLAMMAAMMIPLAGLSGSAIDMGRLYTVKSRLQQACDAGALAGRKMMMLAGNATWSTNATAAAQAYFKSNFRTGWYATTSVNFTPTKLSDAEVQGVATAVVPMTIMKMFGFSSQTLTVTCVARYDVADADVMFVLDTTGSMACTTADDTGSGCGASTSTYTRPDGTTGYYSVEENGSKIAGLRSAVLSFYDTLQTAQTNNPDTHIRYGFVTYTSTVNVGYLLRAANPSYLVSKWNYQSRQLAGDTNSGSSSATSQTKISQSDCNAKAGRTPASGYNSDGSASVVTVSWTAASGNGSPGTCSITTQPVKPNWTYAQYPYDVSSFVTGNSVTDPTKVTGATSKWQGCIEERPTTAGTTSFSQSSLPADLDPDLAPSASVDSNGVPTSSDTRWRPMWPDVVYYRGNNTSTTNSGGGPPLGDITVVSGTRNSDTKPYDPFVNVAQPLAAQAGYTTCGKPAQRLAVMSRSDVSNYVNATDFKAIGGTYHDTGMIWGTRLISPTGIFASDTAAWTGHNAPNRYIVFMTDGYMSPNQYIYGMYGLEYNDKRVSGGDFTNLTNYHNARFLAECNAAKARNITVFVVSFGTALNTQLSSCASPGKAYTASDNAGLTAAFNQIAAQVAMLRISK